MEDFEYLRYLGSGAEAQVHLVRGKNPKGPRGLFALKVISKVASPHISHPRSRGSNHSGYPVVIGRLCGQDFLKSCPEHKVRKRPPRVAAHTVLCRPSGCRARACLANRCALQMQRLRLEKELLASAESPQPPDSNGCALFACGAARTGGATRVLRLRCDHSYFCCALSARGCANGSRAHWSRLGMARSNRRCA